MAGRFGGPLLKQSMHNNYDFEKLLRWFALLDRQMKATQEAHQIAVINEMLKAAGIEEIED